MNNLTKSEFNRLVHKIRQQFVWSQTYKSVINRCKIEFGIMQCEGCFRFICKNEEYQAKLNIIAESSCEKFAIDHIKSVGSLPQGDLNEAVKRIFCDESNLMGLCGTCHYLKTQVDLMEIKEKKSLIGKIESGEL